MLVCAPIPTLNKEEAYAYRRLIVCLICPTNTRPDISFFVNSFSQFVFALLNH